MTAGRGALRARVAVAACLGVGAALLHAWLGRHTAVQGDFAPAWLGARILAAGGDPYSRVGPNAATLALGVRTRWPLVYPPAALVWALPFAALPLAAAQALFAGAGAGLLAFALTAPGGAREGAARWGRLWAFTGYAVLSAVQFAQWEPLLSGAWALAPLGALWAAKPTVGLVTFLASWHRARHAWWAAAGLAVPLLVAWLVAPPMVAEWWSNTRALTHLRVPIATWRGGGPLLLLALGKWRRSDAWLLVTLACMPATTLPYTTVPLSLVAGGAIEALVLALGSWVVIALAPPPLVTAPASAAAMAQSFGAWSASVAPLLVALVYLPCLAMVLRRPNEGPTPLWVERLAAAAAGARARHARPALPNATGALTAAGAGR